ncbi:hypothetical protein BU17DRAFT_12338, partial [Hysterangium stoloniferum]
GLRSFVFSSLGCYFISLLMCDLLQGAAFTLNFRWAVLGSMSEGTLCTIQGAVSQLGDLGAAVWSTAISIHTFWLLFLVRQPHRRAGWFVMVVAWGLLICLSTIGPAAIQQSHRGPFYGLTGAWCWIGDGYNLSRLLFLYAWIFGALFLSLIIYSLIYLRFTLVIPIENRRWPFRLFRSQASLRHAMPTIAQRIMWYPIVYGIVVLPVAVCRMGTIAGKKPPFGAFIFAGICFTSSGMI